MTDLTLRVEYDGGGSDTLNIVSADALGDSSLPSLHSIRIDEQIDRRPEQPDTATATVYRDGWRDIEANIGNIDDKWFIVENGTDIFGGRLNDWEYRDVLVNVILDGPKRDAINETPSAGNTTYTPKADDALVKNDLLPRVGTVGEGTITQQTASIGFSEANSSPGKSIAKLAQATGSETKYKADFTLDYVASLGADKTGTTLSPSNGNVLGEPRIQHEPADDFTHIRVLGSQSGGAQFVADRTVDGTTTRENWGFYSDKDAQTQDRVDQLADQIQSELQNNPDHLELEITIPASKSPALGDEYTVDIPAHNISREPLRIQRLTRVLDESGERFNALLSNRRLARKLTGDQQRRAFDEFRGGNPGQYYALADGDGWDKVESGEDYEMTFYRPVDTLTEYRAKLQIESRPYRLPSSDPGHTHDVDVTHPSHSHSVSISDTTTSGEDTDSGIVTDDRDKLLTNPSSDTETVSINPGSGARLIVTVGIEAALDGSGTKKGTTFANLKRNGNVVFTSTGGASTHEFDTEGRHVLFDFVDPGNQTYKIELGAGANGFTNWSALYSYFVIGRHEHDVTISDTTTSGTALGTTNSETSTSSAALDPGVNEQGGETVSNVAVDIDGSTVVSGLSSSIDETVDIAGEFDDGANDIVATTDTLGELKLTVEYEALKNAN